MVVLSLNNLYNFYGDKASSKRLGRGTGSGKGKTSGRGVKGQKARSGVSIRWFEGGQTSMIKRLPKRGFNNPNKVYNQVVNLDAINNLIDMGVLSPDTVVNKQVLFNFGLLRNTNLPVKLLGGASLLSPIKFDLDSYSAKSKLSVIDHIMVRA